MTSNPPRTKEEALLDLRYEIRLHSLHARLYGRLRAAAAFLSLLFGSAALIGIVGNSRVALGILGLLVFIVSIGDIVWNWADKGQHHRTARKNLCAVLGRVAEMSMDDMDAALARHAEDCVDCVESLRVVAYNDNVRSNGHEDWVRPESRLQRFMRALA